MQTDESKRDKWAKEINEAKVPSGKWAANHASSGYEWRKTLTPCGDGQVRDVRICAQTFHYPSTEPAKTIMGLQPMNGVIVRIDGESPTPIPRGTNLFLHDFYPTKTVEPLLNGTWEIRTFWFLSRPLPKQTKQDTTISMLGLLGLLR